MKRYFDTARNANILAVVALVAGLIAPSSALPATVALATVPLANATTTNVLPNLMFILDASGSMDWNYLPDWVDDSICKNTNGSYNRACTNSPPFQSPDFNGVYYNPEITYLPPVDGLGNTFASQTTWTSVKNDAYGIQSTSRTNLVTEYVDVEWCTDETNSRGSYTYADCLRNDNYLLPGVVNGKTYNVTRATTSDGTGLVATGSPDNPTTATRTWGPHYYRISPGEWCSSTKLTNCQSVQSAGFTVPARLRWCNSEANAKAATPAANACQGLRAGSFKFARFPTKTFAAAVPAKASFTFSMSGCSSSTRIAGIASIKVNNVNILPEATGNTRSGSTLADEIRDMTPSGNYTFGGSGSTLVINAPASAGNVTHSVVLTRTSSSNSSCIITSSMSTSMSGYVAAAGNSGAFVRTDIVSGRTYPRAAGRTDCSATTTCTYTEEMTNFANWWTYYQTRMQTMKTSVSRAFRPIDNRYRVGFIDIYGNNYLAINAFTSGTNNVKDTWYKKLFSVNPSGGTPLRSALSSVGRIYAGKKTGSDPIQYSCQQNFALLTTDGYWNGDTAADVKGLDGRALGNADGGNTPRPMYEGPIESSNSLADVAKYYYDNDLRTPDLGNCNGALNINVCANNVFRSSSDDNKKQHMTTFTLGLGVDGSVAYTSDYKTAPEGDFKDITNGTGSTVVNWPVPVADTETAVDDLWHAAVNGQGTYFSAKDPTQLTTGLNAALAALDTKIGAGSAAATSSLNPVAGDNFAYVASYTTGKWQGNLEARTINLATSEVSETPSWCVENTVASRCTEGEIVASDSGSSTTYYCVTPDATAETCVDGTLEGTSCKVQVPVACTGTMASTVAAAADTRTIKMAQLVGTTRTLVDFEYARLTDTQKTYFAGTGLSQWALLTTEQKELAAGANMVSFLRGQTGFEDRTANPVLKRLYRYREATLGDATESQPAFVGKPAFTYADTGYANYVSTKTTRAKTVYIGTNDGMLHAFDADNGQERWAFVPTAVIPNMWRLADKNYSSMHTNYVNGRPVIADVFNGTAWRTILVAGLNGGGRGYYALDITDPAAPSLLWEIDSASEPNLGYSYGYPLVTKTNDGTWVVLFTSGYNNVSPGDGRGYLYVRNALTGAHISRISTGTDAGSTTTPSGLARISNWGDDPARNNTSVFAYGGDLLGNVWRFDINAANTSANTPPTLPHGPGTVMKFAILKDPSGNPQPVTAAPELGLVYGKRVIMVGTGKYLENIDLTDFQRQSLYAIKDDNAVTTFDNPRLTLVDQTITEDTATSTRTATQHEVNFRTGRGWFVDFPGQGERIHVDPRLDSGLLIAPTTVPSNEVCFPGGFGWLNYFNYLTGNNDTNIVSQRFDAPIVGFNVFYVNGVRQIGVVTANNPTPQKPPRPILGGDDPMNFKGKRVIWRELIP